MLYGSVSETHSSKTATRNFYLTNGIYFQSGNDTKCKGEERYAIFQTTLHAQQTATEQTPDLPSKPTNAEISFRVVLHDRGKAPRWRWNLDHSEADSNTILQQMRTPLRAVSTSSYWSTDYHLTPGQFVWQAVLTTLSGAVSVPHRIVWFVKFPRALQSTFIHCLIQWADTF